MNEVEQIKSEIIEKAVQRIENELNSKFVTHEELLKAMKEYQEHKDVYDIAPGTLTKAIRDIVFKGAMSESTGPAGGYLVPPQYVSRIIDVAIQQSVVYPKVTRIPVASNQAYLTGVSSAVTFQYPGEATATNPTAPTLYQGSIPIKKGMALIDIPNELIQDASIGGEVDAFIVNLIGKAFGKEMDRILVAGNTANGDPFNGILNTSGITYVVEPAGHTSDVNYDSLTDVITAIPDDYKLDPYWIIHRTFLAQIYKMKDNTGRPYFEPSMKEIFGYPYVRLEVMPSDFSASKPIALFCDPANILFGMRQDLVIEASKEAKFSQDLTELKATFRFGFYVAYPQTFVVLQTSAT